MATRWQVLQHLAGNASTMLTAHPFLISQQRTCSDSIAKLFRACFFMGYRTIIARYVAKWGIARMCPCKIRYQWGVSHHFGGVLASLKNVSGDMGYRSDSIAVSRDMGP